MVSLCLLVLTSLYLFALLSRGDLGGVIGFIALISFLIVPLGVFFCSILAYSLIWFFKEKKQQISYSKRILVLFLGVVGVLFLLSLNISR